MPAVVEGVTTARSVYDRTHPLGLDMPITAAVYRVLSEGVSPADALNELMARRSGSERVRRD
jgi:glycerol-3-phosphate dehydrogenase (NAD(P)+)